MSFMSLDVQDLLNLIKHVVKSDSTEEKDFIKRQLDENIKICDKVYTENENGREVIKVVTQLSRDDDLGDNAQCEDNVTITNSDFYISSLQISSNSLKETSITTVLGLMNSDLEAVYEASVALKPQGSKLVLHSSYLRPAKKPSLTKSSSLNREDVIVKHHSTEPSKKKSIFKRFSKSKKNSSDLKDIDALAKAQVIPGTSDTEKKEQVSKNGKDKIHLLNLKKELPFQSYTIGSYPGSIKDFFSPSRGRSRSFLHPPIEIRPKKMSSLKIEDKNNDKSTFLTATIDNAEHPIIFNSIVTGPGEDSESASATGSVFDSSEPMFPSMGTNVDLHVNIPAQITDPGRRSSCPTISCTCNEERLKLLGDLLTNVSRRESVRDLRRQLDEFDLVSHHRHDCRCEFKSYRTDEWRKSIETLHSHCESCCSTGEPISPTLRQSLDCLVEQHDPDVDIQLSENDLAYFMTVHCYDNFERFVRSFIGTRVTPLQFSRLILIITRTIVRHIGNPRDKSNKHIDRIYELVIKYYSRHFFPHIKVHHTSLDDFLMNCECNNYHDID